MWAGDVVLVGWSQSGNYLSWSLVLKRTLTMLKSVVGLSLLKQKPCCTLIGAGQCSWKSDLVMKNLETISKDGTSSSGGLSVTQQG